MSAVYGTIIPESREQEMKELKEFWKVYMLCLGGILTPASLRKGRDKKDDAPVLSPVHPRPILRVTLLQFLSKFGIQEDVEKKWQVTDEFMAKIEKADLDMQTKQQQSQSLSHP
ncbi:hypothetical protein VKT23_008700 [Stygiomarasmius scandens]|uniref:Uncharacterized protein n=1 Tax=Marasmiellus scandens TaxID=2682957 RepID=A0ABR1JH79_9AGAR